MKASATKLRIVAVYYGEGTRAGAVWIMNALDVLNIPYFPITEKDICNNCLNDFSCLFLGSGGFYYNFLGKTGCENIAAFVHSGGGYLGHCGGAVAAANPYPGSKGSRNLILIPINILTDKSSEKIKPFFIDERRCFRFKKTDTINNNYFKYLPLHIPMVYWQGPLFHEPETDNIHVIYRFPKNSTYKGNPALLAFESPENNGRIIICSAHPEMCRTHQSLSLLQTEIEYVTSPLPPKMKSPSNLYKYLIYASSEKMLTTSSFIKTVNTLSSHAAKLILLLKAIPVIESLFFCYPEFLMTFLQRLIKECTHAINHLSQDTKCCSPFPEINSISSALENTGKFLTFHAKLIAKLSEDDENILEDERSLYKKTIDELKYSMLPLIRWNILRKFAKYT